MVITRQEYAFKLGKNGYVYQATIKRNTEGSIIDSDMFGPFIGPNVDTETWIAHLFNLDADIWSGFDQQLYTAKENETFIYYLNLKEFIKNNEFDDEDLEFLNEISTNGYIKLYITVIENIL